MIPLRIPTGMGLAEAKGTLPGGDPILSKNWLFLPIYVGNPSRVHEP